MAEYLRAPGQADQVIMLEYTAMTLKIASRFQREDKMFVREADQLRKVTLASIG